MRKRLLIVSILALLIGSLLLYALPAVAEDPLLVPSDQQPKSQQVLQALQKAGINKDYVKLEKDFGKRSEGKSPYAQTWVDQKSGTRVMEVSSLPMVDADGVKIEAGWRVAGINYFTEKNNLFWAKVQGISIELKVKNDQPDGRKTNDTLSFAPQLFLNGIEVKPISSTPTLLPVDPVNPNYLENTLEWDYGICKRKLRIIEGSILGSWVFVSNPNGEVRIKYNQTGDYRLKLGQFKVSDDEEVIPQSIFTEAKYPFTISDSATFYPDAHTESTSVDGIIVGGIGLMTWAQLIADTGQVFDDSDDGASSRIVRIASTTTTDKWANLNRGIFLFDSSGLPDAAIISAATLSLYGNTKYDNGSFAPNINIYSSAPASNVALAAGDFDSLGSTAFCDTPITYANWIYASPFWNDFALNATGLAAIDKTGVSKFGARNANYDVAATSPTWAYAKECQIGCYFSEKGTGYKPKLVVTYTVPAAPTVTTSAASNIAATTARLNGNVTNTGGENPTVTVYWGTSNGGTNFAAWTNNSTADSPAQPQGVAAFYKDAGSLSPLTLYYFSASGNNSYGIGWGTTKSFTTLANPPTVTTQAATLVEETTATGNGNITATGGENATRRGFCYMVGTAGDPTTANSTAYDDGNFGTGTYTKGMTGLTPGESYRVRAYALNSGGTGYGSTVQMYTKCNDPTALAVGSKTTTSIYLTWTKGTGSENTTILYKTTGYPANVTDGTVCYGNTGASTNVTPLTHGQIYYFSAWAWDTNAGYSDGYVTVNETTLADPPTVTTQAVSAITATTATGSGNITDIGGENATRGICWNTTGSPTVADFKEQEAGTFGVGVFTEPMTGLTHTTLYFVKAYAFNSGGYGYGNEVTFTSSNTTPTVTTQAADNINTTNATGHWTITDTGGENATLRGIEWGTTTLVYTTNTTQGGTFGVGSYSLNMTGLNSSTTYYYRGLAQNPKGFGYGNEMSFTTAPVTPAIIVTGGASGIFPNYATLQGTLMDLGSSSSIGVSFEYGTTTSYGTTTPESQLAAIGGFTYQIGGLSYNTLYHFRARGRYGLFYAYGGDMTFTTLPAYGASTDIRIISAKMYSDFITDGDLLLVVEAVNNYTNLYPGEDPREHFTIQLLATNKIDILGASPLANWGDRPESIYFNPTVVSTTLTYGAAYWVRMIGDNISGFATVDYHLLDSTNVSSDWKGNNLTKLDSWCIGACFNMASSDSVAVNTYITPVTDTVSVISDYAGGYFTTGIPAIAQQRPYLFATAQYEPPINVGTAFNFWDSATAWQTFVGTTIAGDATTIAIPFGISGKDLLFGVVMLAMLGCVMVVVGGTGGFGALGAVLISVPILWLGTYFRIVSISVIIVMILIFGMFAIRQFVIKTL